MKIVLFVDNLTGLAHRRDGRAAATTVEDLNCIVASRAQAAHAQTTSSRV